MGFRFRKYIRLAPGLKINISKSGASATLGGKGAAVNVGKGGVRATVGLPGSGMSYTTDSLPLPGSDAKKAEGWAKLLLIIAIVAVIAMIVYVIR